VLANLPYVAERDWLRLQPEVTQWEPKEALLAGPDGLDAYRDFFLSRRVCVLSRDGTQNTNSAGGEAGVGAEAVAAEVGEGQAAAVGEMLREAGFSSVQTRTDLAGIERVVVGEP
jgi:release factor glutamine methyltransferase